MSGGLIGPEYDMQIRSTIRDLQGGKRRRRESVDAYPVRDSSRFPRYQAILDDDLFAAVDVLSDPSTAEATVLKRKANGNLKRSSLKLTVVNRFKNISIDAGTYIKIEFIDGEWQPYAADCPGGSESLGSSITDGSGGGPEPEMEGP